MSQNVDKTEKSGIDSKNTRMEKRDLPLITTFAFFIFFMKRKRMLSWSTSQINSHRHVIASAHIRLGPRSNNRAADGEVAQLWRGENKIINQYGWAYK